MLFKIFLKTKIGNPTRTALWEGNDLFLCEVVLNYLGEQVKSKQYQLDMTYGQV